MLKAHQIIDFFENGDAKGVTEALIELAREVYLIEVHDFEKKELARDGAFEVNNELEKVIEEIINFNYQHEVLKELVKLNNDNEDKITEAAIKDVWPLLNNTSYEVGLSGGIDEGKEPEEEYVQY